MMKKVFKPFWSYDVEKTEKWLSSMAEKGFIFVKASIISRRFVFEKGEPQQFTYSIVYDKARNLSLPRTLLDDGWCAIQTQRNWHIIANEQPIEQINTFPNREGVLKHNRVMMYIFGGVLIYLSFSLLMSLTLITS